MLRIGHMASHPPRRMGLIKRVQELLPQLDTLRLYLNNYDPGIVKALPADTRLEVVLSGPGTQFPDMGSQGKLMFLDRDLDRCNYYLCMDDDICYSSGYVDFMVRACESYGNRALVSLHGGVFRLHCQCAALPEHVPAKRLRNLRHYDRYLAYDRPVHMLGNGCSCYVPSRIGLDRTCVQGPLHSGDDEDLAVWAQKHGIASIVVAHTADLAKPDSNWNIQAMHLSRPQQDLSDIKLKQWKRWGLQQLPPKTNS